MGDDAGRGHTRGRFLGLATIGLGTAAAGAVAVPAVGYLGAPVLRRVRFRPVSLGPFAAFRRGPDAVPAAAPFVQDAAQPATSAGLAYVHDTGHASHDWRSPQARFIVFSNRCMHVGCPVAASIAGFACPCHGGQYDRLGRPVAGPPVRPLDRFQWEIRGGELWLTNRWSVLMLGDRVTYLPVKAPGQPLTLAGSRRAADLLYPAVTYLPPAG
jgi:menaquinol-cytochrome c reductase iron-sulfur subunit